MTVLCWFLICVLSVWRITHLLSTEDGPFKCIYKLRRFIHAGPVPVSALPMGRAARMRAVLAELLDCFYCLSLWIAAPFALLLGRGWREVFIIWPALSGAAILLERITAPRAPAYLEDPVETLMEVEYELLRKNENRRDKSR